MAFGAPSLPSRSSNCRPASPKSGSQRPPPLPPPNLPVINKRSVAGLHFTVDLKYIHVEEPLTFLVGLKIILEQLRQLVCHSQSAVKCVIKTNTQKIKNEKIKDSNFCVDHFSLSHLSFCVTVRYDGQTNPHCKTLECITLVGSSIYYNAQ